MMPYFAPDPSSPRAREAAQWLDGEARARRMPPVVSVEARFDEVLVTVDPAGVSEAWHWDVWANFLCVSMPGVCACRDGVQGHGVWRDVPVVLTGLHPEQWGGAR